MTTALYAALLTLWLVLLSMRVIALRGNPMFAFLTLGDSQETMLDRAIRAQGNLTEYAPMMLILLYLLETLGQSAWTLHVLGSLFLLGRLMHGICFGFMTSSMPLRIGGTALTLFPMLGAALTLLSAVM
tara:strand:- start:552 stop:938 length:387 start_codon:yes stop_codon:yes gene_type:complete